MDSLTFLPSLYSSLQWKASDKREGGKERLSVSCPIAAPSPLELVLSAFSPTATPSPLELVLSARDPTGAKLASYFEVELIKYAKVYFCATMRVIYLSQREGTHE